MAFCVGLTGGIGSGKSAAARMFAELGAEVVDTDAIAHRLTGPGQAALEALRSRFGEEYLLPDGSLDREKMRRLVFSDERARRDLEAILHPLIRSAVARAIAASGAPYVVAVVPLLLETGAYRQLVRRVLVVDCPDETQIARAMQRSGLSEKEVRAIMAAQLGRAARLKGADDVLRNDAGLGELRELVAALHRKYLELAQPPP